MLISPCCPHGAGRKQHTDSWRSCILLGNSTSGGRFLKIWICWLWLFCWICLWTPTISQEYVQINTKIAKMAVWCGLNPCRQCNFCYKTMWHCLFFLFFKLRSQFSKKKFLNLTLWWGAVRIRSGFPEELKWNFVCSVTRCMALVM